MKKYIKHAAGSKGSIVFVASALLLASAMALIAGGGKYGPYDCPGCALVQPYPDSKTRQRLDDATPALGLLWYNHGDIYIVCNESACVEYEVTETFQWYSTEPARTIKANGGGRGGEGGSGYGGNGVGGGCIASCGAGSGSAGSGSVIIGEDEKLPPKNGN
ncbi:MAG TPA: hypothetical protein VIT90_10615 [Lysobacter sp.]